MQNSQLAGQVTPLQQENAKLKEELSYKDKRIQELQEPQAVMSSSLSQGFGATSPAATPSSSFGASASPMTSTTPGMGASPGMGGQGGGSVGLSTSKRECPNCGASGFAIKEVEDRSKIISYIPKPIYAKKKVCTKCGYEF